MAATEVAAERPDSPEEAAELLRALGDAGRVVRVRGGGTKLAWGAPGADAQVELRTGGLTRMLEHNEGDFTAVLEVGMPFAEAQATFARCGQMFALDPPLGDGEAATVGGVIAASDSGPLRHRYGGVRDLIVGMTVALSDGKLSTSGGRVIKNVAGYDIAKLFSGSMGTLGLIVSVSLRVHPRPEANATAWGTSDDPHALAGTAAALARLPLEADALDAGWKDGAGRLLVRFSGATAERQADAVCERLRAGGLQDVRATADDEELWAAQRAGQRSAGDAVLKVSALPADLGVVLGAARDADAALVSRAALGLSWLTLTGEDLAARAGALRAALAPCACTLLDAPAAVREQVPPWPEVEPGSLAVMRRVKERFDPARIFRPGAYVGGI